MAKTKSKTSTSGPIKIGYADDLAEMFEIPDFEHLEERNRDSITDAGDAAYERAKDRFGDDEEDAEEARADAEQAAQDDLFNTWRNAAEGAIEGALDNIGLELINKKGVYSVAPKSDWTYAATKITEVINGVGMFEFSSVAEFLRSGPYTPRQAVAAHFVYAAKMRSKVFGTSSIERNYRNNFR